MKNVCIIGGSGTKSTLLALRSIEGVKIHSIISVFDSGGHTGFLRKKMGIYAIGDIRDNLIASSGNQEISSILDQRMEVNGVKHSVGNLVLSSLIRENGGDYIQIARKILQIPSNIEIIPVTRDINYDGDLVIETENGELVGEHNLDSGKRIKVRGIKLSKEAYLNPDAESAIKEADYIFFGPGDIYSSILVNTLVRGFHSAFKESKAKKILVMNIMNKMNETDGFAASDFVKAFHDYGIRFDKIIVNTKKPKTTQKMSKYGRLCGFVKNDIEGEDVIAYDVVDEDMPFQHDVDKLSLVLNRVIKDA